MSKRNRYIITLILNIIKDKSTFIVWISIRFLSAFIPLLSIYLYSKTINLVETNAGFSSIFFALIIVLVVRVIDNFARIRSVTKLDMCISEIGFNIHNYFIKDIKSETKLERYETIQTIRNFSDATVTTLTTFRQPGIDSIISLISIPIILLFVDFKVFILVLAYIVVYCFIDHYTTQKYIKFKDIQDGKIESYYGKFQQTNDVDLEQKTYNRHFNRLCNWSFTEWFTLQNSAVFFYTLILSYLIISISTGAKLISDLILIMGYVSSTQTYLNSFSTIKDSLSDMNVAVEHLAKNKNISVIDFDDLI